VSLFDKETECPCAACKARRSDYDSDNVSGVVHAWDYTPRRWSTKRVRGDSFPYAMGVELETSVGRTNEGPLWQETAVGLRRPKTLWFAKYDSSVGGPEFVSHPATLTYWKAKAKELQEMFSLLIHAGYRSHNGGEAGMHINIDKTAFSDARHLHRFLTFLYANENWVLAVSQRSSNQLEQWARQRPYTLSTAERMLGSG
jgi:hypothetical protein